MTASLSHFAPAFSRIDLRVSRFCSHLCRSREDKYLGLEGRAGWSKGWGNAGSEDGMPGCPRPPGWPRPTEGLPAPNSFTLWTHLKVSLQILPHDEVTYVDKASAFCNLIFDAVSSKRMLGIKTICIC